MTQVILLGAGLGSRLDSLRGSGPKWTLEIAQQSLAQHLVNAFHHSDVTDVLLVRGALGGSVLTPSVAYREALGTRNMVETLYSVRGQVHDDVVVSYCDLILEPRIVSELLRSPADAVVVVDRGWRRLFQLRADDPLSIAESCRLTGERIQEIGQPLKEDEIPEAQYVGLMRFSASVFEQLMALYESLASEFAGQRWRNARTFEAAFFTDFLQEAVTRGLELAALTVEGGWLEFDTPRDVTLAEDLLSSTHPEIFDFAALPRSPSILSAGGVAIRRHGSCEEALLVGSGADGEWRIPKGMLERGETIQAAALREVEEETGVPVRIELPLGSEDWTYTFDGREWWERCYFYRLAPVAETTPHPDSEHAVAKWVREDIALRGMKYESERRILAAALAKP